MNKRYSFDVFDTLITRKTATPHGVFAYMQKVLREDTKYADIKAYIRDNFYLLRIGAEQAARVYFGSDEVEDVTLEQIYEAMGRTHCLSAEEGSMLAALERAAELELVVGIDKNIDYLRDLYTRGKKVLLISDMYLDSATIRKMLVKVDSVFANIPLYVSSDYLKNKVTGNLFTYVMEKENINTEDWVHIGDNPHSDGQIPEKMGITIQAVNAKVLLPCEQAVLKNREDNIAFQLAIGASANARLDSERKSAAYTYGTSLGGNIAFSYVYWLIQRSLEKGIKRLYFIARDGYLLKEIADRIIEQNAYDIYTSYIYGSRKVWRLPTLSREHFDIARMVYWGARKQLCHLDKLAELFEITEEELRIFLPPNYADRQEMLEEDQLMELSLQLEENIEFRDYIIERQADKRELLLEYIKQEVDVSDEHFAFVELIGSGYTQCSLSYLLKELCEYPVRTFFYHMDAQMDSDQCQFYCYFPSDMQGGGLMELFYTAPHGHTIGYCWEEDGRVEPVLDGECEAVLSYGLEDYITGVQDFLRAFSNSWYYISDKLENVTLSLTYRKYMAEDVDSELLAYMGDMPYKFSGREQEAFPYAPKLDAESVRFLYVRDGYKNVYNRYRGHNLELSNRRIAQEEKDVWKRIFGFPIDRLERRIAIYGAGKFGQALYRELGTSMNHEVVLWVDKNYAELSKRFSQLSTVDKLADTDFDQVVIAILDLTVAQEAKEELIRRGIDEGKIVTYELAL